MCSQPFCCGVSICRECVGRTLTTKRNGFKNLDIIVYINQLSEEKDNKVQQNAQVLNLSKDPVNWLLYLKMIIKVY